MRIFIQFPESYFELVAAVCSDLKNSLPESNLSLSGIGIRRRTICQKIDGLVREFGEISYDLWNDVEVRILNGQFDPERLVFYRESIGDRKLRELMICGRQLGFGFMTGGVHARSKFLRLIEECDQLRWQYIVGVLDYYLERFSNEKPDLVFFNEVAFPWEMAAYLIAEYLQIPFFTLCYAHSGGGYVVNDNPYQRCSSIVHKMVDIEKGEDQDVVSELKEAQRRLESFRNQPVAPDYTIELHKIMMRQSSLPGIIKTFILDMLKHGAISLGLLGTRGVVRFEHWGDMARFNLSSAIQSRRALRKNSTFEKASQFAGFKYLYYPLHVEPEITTTVLSPLLSNQLTFIEQIARSMPAGYKLLVKEHQPSLGRRPKGYYERIKAFPDVHLLSPFEDNFSLIKHAQVVCVISGTAGWEGIMLGVPVIVVGEAQYLGVGDGYIRCENLFKLDDDIAHALKMKPACERRICAFIAATLKIQSNLSPKKLAYWHYGLDPKEALDSKEVESLAKQLMGFYKKKSNDL